MRVSLRLKFILALLFTSLMAVAMVGLGARWLLLRNFSDAVRDDAFSRYRIALVAYVKSHGSLEKALLAEPFGEFQRRYDSQRSAHGFTMLGWSPYRLPDGPGARMQMPGAWPGGPGPVGMAPPPGPGGMPQYGGGPGGPPNGAPPDFMPPADGSPSGAGPADSGQRPPFVPSAVDPKMPPFRFLLLDPAGKVLSGDTAYHMGSYVPDAVRKQAKPVLVNGQVVALAAPLARPNLNGLDRAYLGAVNQALLYAGGGALLLTLLLGVLLGRRLSRDLRRLTGAVEQMARGHLRQQVTVESTDEIAVLAGAFNRMSADLARAHEELQESALRVQEQAARLQELSVRDPLTGIHNRRHFDEQANQLYAQSVRYRQPLTFMVGDLDFFKRINDQFSHAVGDEVLRRVAVLLRSNLRESDVVARYGGEEFVVAFTQTPVAQAAVACEKLRRIIEEYPWHEIAPGLRVTMSMGLCDDLGLPNPGRMLDRADAYLYLAKEEGRNRVAYQALRRERMALRAS